MGEQSVTCNKAYLWLISILNQLVFFVKAKRKKTIQKRRQFLCLKWYQEACLGVSRWTEKQKNVVSICRLEARLDPPSPSLCVVPPARVLAPDLVGIRIRRIDPMVPIIDGNVEQEEHA